jgi:hypothetical protein
MSNVPVFTVRELSTHIDLALARAVRDTSDARLSRVNRCSGDRADVWHRR